MCAVCVCVLASGMAMNDALAQSGTSGTKKPVVLQPPTPPTGESTAPWMPTIMMFLFVAIIVGVNFIPSKRGHQD